VAFDFTNNERKWQKTWKENKTFDAEPSSKKKFFINYPYPYISGSLHIGHGMAALQSDVMARFKRMRGFNVLFPSAFHVSGTPVLGISLGIKTGDKKFIDLYSEYVRAYGYEGEQVAKLIKSFEDPQSIVDFFIPKMQEEFSRLGLSVDWRRSFNSASPDHQALVEWQFRKYKEKGYLVQGKYPIMFSKSLNNAVGEDDIKDGDTNPVELQEFTGIKFKFEDGFLVAATLRPETMYGQTNMWVNPEVEYVTAEVNGEKWFISQECADKLSYQDKKVKIIGKVSGKSMLGKTCFAPFVEREIPILPSSHCNPDVGTGIVTSVPSDAPFDYISLKELQDSKQMCEKYGLNYDEIKAIKLIPIIRSKGFSDFAAVDAVKKFGIKNLSQDDKLKEATQEVYKAGFHTGVMNENCGPYSGMPVAKAKDAMRKEVLKKDGTIIYETSRQAVSRDGGKVIVAVLDGQWFLDFNAKGWKDKARECLAGIAIWPEKYRHQFELIFDWLGKRPCARARGLGTQLPFDKKWVIESLSDSTLYMALYPIAHTIRANNIPKEKLNDSFFDYILLSKGDAKSTAKTTGIDEKILSEMHDEWNYWYPFDQRHTFALHIPSHLSFMIFAHAGILDKKDWPKMISFHGMVTSEGEKMSKSKGNVVTLLQIANVYGADPYRALICNSANVDSDIDWQADKIEVMRRQLSTLYDLLKSMQESKKADAKVLAKYKYFVSRTERLFKTATDCIGKMDFKTYSNIAMYSLFAEYKKVRTLASAEEMSAINAYLVERWIALLAPMTPHLAEELWSLGGRTTLVSTSNWPAYDESLIDDKLEHIEDSIDNLRQDVLKIKEVTKMAKVSSLKVFVSPAWKWKALRMIKAACVEKPDIGLALKAVMADPELKVHASEMQSVVKNALAKFGELGMDEYDEFAVLEEAKPRLSAEFGKVEIVKADESNEPKAKFAFPGRPALLLA